MSSFGRANAVLAAAVIFLLLSSSSSYFAFVRLQTSQQWVQHTFNVQHAMDHFSTMLSRAGRLRSEYVNSGDATILSRQADAVVDIRTALTSIQQLTSDNVTEQDHCRKLAEITEHRIALMDQSIALRRSGKSTLESQAAISRQITVAGDATEAVLERMEDEEKRLLGERQRREGASFFVVSAILLTSLFLALVLFLIHHQMLTDQVRERQRAEVAQRNLSARLLTLQDEERRKFARELHDSVGQQLAAMKMGIAMLERKLPGEPIILDCLKLLDDAIGETRTISHLLHPPLLDEAGLNSAFRWFVEGFAKRSGINVNLQIEDGSQRFEAAVELVLFRALQESLTNVHRHSGAKQADVRLTTSAGYVILSIRDHGRGIPAAVLQNLRHDGTAGGVGLAGMTERLREIGGRLDINSGPQGSEIVARVPMRRRVAPAVETLPSTAQEVNG